MLDRISGDAVNPSCWIHGVDSVDSSQFLRGDLSRSGLFAPACGRKGKYASGSQSKHATDDALFSHAETDQRIAIVVLLQEAHHLHVVMQTGGGSDDLVVVRREGFHLREGFFDLLRLLEVVEGQQQRSLAADLVEVSGFERLCAFQFDIDNLASGRGRFQQEIELGSQRSLEPPAILDTAAGGDHGGIHMRLKELLDPRDRCCGIFQVVESELEEGIVADKGLRFFHKFRGVVANDRHADFGQPKATKPRPITIL